MLQLIRKLHERSGVDVNSPKVAPYAIWTIAEAARVHRLRRADLPDLSEVPGMRIGARAVQPGCRVQRREEFALTAAEVQMVTLLPVELLPAKRVPAQVMARERVRLSGHGARRGTVAHTVSQGFG